MDQHECVLEKEATDIYLSNIAMAYAALLETKNKRGVFEAQKVMTDIRDFVFDNLLSGGTVLNGVEERALSADQILAVMPYGLFSPEDLVVVEATQQMVLHLSEQDGMLPFRGATQVKRLATALFALYYQEKSEREKALYYAQQARSFAEEDELADVLLNVFDHFAAQNNQAAHIVHRPLGNENVYERQLTERIPHYPTTEEYVQLACQVVSDIKIRKVSIEVENEAGTWRHVESLSPAVKDNTLVYETKLAPLPKHDRYDYRFVAELEDGSALTSETYDLSTLQRQQATSFQVVDQETDRCVLQFGEEHLLTMTLSDKQLSFTIQQKGSYGSVPQNKRTSVKLQSGDYSVMVEESHCAISVYKENKRMLSTHPLYAPIEWNTDVDGTVRSFTIHWYSPAHERFYGFGERYNALEQRGEIIDCYVYNQYRDQGTRTYIPIPFYMTNGGYGCFINTMMYTTFDLAAGLKDKCSVTFAQNERVTMTNLHFYFGDFQGQLQQYTEQTGKPTMLPAWALGPWMSSNNWDRQSIVEQEVEATKQHDIPATVIVLEQWSDEATYYMFNDATYELKEPGYVHSYDEMTFPSWGRWPDPKKMVASLHADNLKLILWQIPIQKYLNKQTHPLKDQDESYMIKNGYVVKNKDGSPYRIPENWFTNSLLMDFSHPEGREWWFAKRQYLLDLGVDGFKTDGGEFVFGKNVQFANGQTGSEMRNQYPNDYVEAYYRFAQQNHGMTFSRAGYTGAQNFPRTGRETKGRRLLRSNAL
nr:TIM-barrel domain-containing protein [Litoribacterium kuwaitense]